MDKNQIIGFVLIFAVVLGWSIWSAPSAEEIEQQKRVQDSLEQVRLQQDIEARAAMQEAETAEIPEASVSDSVALARLQPQYGDFADVAIGEEKTFDLENSDIKITFSSKGGKIIAAELKNHYKVVDMDNNKVTVRLLADLKNKFSYSLPFGNRNIDTEDLYFQGNPSGRSISFTVNTPSGQKFMQTYTLAEEGYKLDYNIEYAGITDAPIYLNWVDYLDTLERGIQFEKRYSTVYFKEAEEDDADYCSCTSSDTEELSDAKIQWISHSNQFFNSSLMAKGPAFASAVLETDMLEEDAEDLKLLKSKLEIPVSGTTGKYDMAMYIGPNEYKRLASYDNGLQEIIPFGRSIFGTINRHFIRPFFDFLSQYIGSKGIVIIALIFIIKMALYPLMYKMLHSQAKMGALKPEIAKMKEKFADEPQKQQMETMKLYREYGVSPFGGCMPMILQMPIWYALFRFFPASITFRQESFLWATDLSSYDVFFRLPFEIPMFGAHVSLFTLLWAVTTIIYTYYNTKHMDMSANPAMKYVQYFMPIGFLAFFNSYASGLTVYMFFSNLINIAQTIITKAYVFDDEKIRQELFKNKEKPKKKTGFQARLEEAMKKQQQIATQQQTGKKGKKTRRK